VYTALGGYVEPSTFDVIYHQISENIWGFPGCIFTKLCSGFSLQT
jgi:hypothetical protein